jgi:RimJ/RimL family protein N-acetyltransferase
MDDLNVDGPFQFTDGTITVRTPVPEDVPTLSAVVRSSSSFLSPFMPWATPDYDDEAAMEWVARMSRPDEIPLVIVGPDGELAGGSGLNLINPINRFGNLGYWLRADRTGRGWATRATRLVARFGLNEVGLGRIEILMAVANEPSRLVAERSGAVYEGRLRNRLVLHGEYHDAFLYSIIESD